MSRWLRSVLVAAIVLVGLPVVVLLVEVQLARWGPQLPDGDGSRPQGLVSGRSRAGPPVHIVWLGDSTTTGVGVVDFEDSMAHRTALDAVEALDRPVSLTVLGVSGAQIDGVLDEQVAGLAGLDADVVVISIGANDVTHLTGKATFASRYATLLDEVAELAPGSEVVVLGVPDLGSAPRFAQPLRFVAGLRGSQLNDEVRAAARAERLQYIDLAAETGPPFRQDPGRYFSDDQFHPNEAGHALWAWAARGEIVTAARRAID